MSRKYLLDCSASGAKWADDVHHPNFFEGLFLPLTAHGR